MALFSGPKPIGKIVHFYDNIGVGVLRLSGTLKVGDTIKIKRGDVEFSQSVDSMQIEHESVSKAKKGDDVGIKLEQKIKEGATVVKV